VNIKELVENRSLIIEREKIPAIVEIGLEIKMYRFQSWFIRLANIVLVLYSKTY